MIINGSSTKLFAGVGLAVLAVPRLGNVRLRLHFLRRGTRGGIKSENENWDYKYQSTGAAGKTTFIKLTDEWKKANRYTFPW